MRVMRLRCACDAMGRRPIRGPILLPEWRPSILFDGKSRWKVSVESLGGKSRWKVSVESIDEESGMKNPDGEGGRNEERAGCGKKDVC